MVQGLTIRLGLQYLANIGDLKRLTRDYRGILRKGEPTTVKS